MDRHVGACSWEMSLTSPGAHHPPVRGVVCRACLSAFVVVWMGIYGYNAIRADRAPGTGSLTDTIRHAGNAEAGALPVPAVTPFFGSPHSWPWS
ncbi:hypothetical protein QJS66_02645 [Kocuria rhizophila]|nr:hypothetical protein QJS66_02645 [Kocuria rhizophila]